MNQLFEASSASHFVLDADLQRYFRDVDVLYQHALMQPLAPMSYTDDCSPGWAQTQIFSEDRVKMLFGQGISNYTDRCNDGMQGKGGARRP